jgi:hypothetical protein
MASKGCSALLVWILTGNNSQLGLTTASKKTDGNEDNIAETVDANKALREEVLNFATAGIRSSARAGAKATPDRKMITRRPQQHESADSGAFENLINPMFFVRFVLGYTDELTALEELVGNKQRSVNETFMRQTTTIQPSPNSSHLRTRTPSTASTVNNGVDGMRLSQRPTIVSGTDHTRQSVRPSFFAGALSYFSRGSAMEAGHAADPEAGMELDSFGGKDGGRRSSSMVETDSKDVEAAQSTERFDLGKFLGVVSIFKSLRIVRENTIECWIHVVFPSLRLNLMRIYCVPYIPRF